VAIRHSWRWTTGFFFERYIMKMKRCFIVLLLLLFQTAGANEPKLVVATVENSADAVTSRAVMVEAYGRLGIAVEFRAYTAAAALAASNSGDAGAELARIDGIDQVFENLVQVPIPINLIKGVAFSRKYRFPITGWHSLRPYRIGIVKGIVFAEQQTIGMDRQVFNSYSELIQAMNDDLIEVGVMPRVEGLKAIANENNKDIFEMEGILETLFLYHYVHVSRSNLVNKLTPVLKKMLLSGEIRKIRERLANGIMETE
jgi:polar amino acid transport system substrate-binding protein